MDRNPIKILIIDDILDNIKVLKAIIKEEFTEAIVLTALSGELGLEITKSIEPDMIFLDIVMPDMDGYEVCKRLKKDKQLVDIPVVFITALKEEAGSRIVALEVGAEAFLSKPIDKSELIAQIRAMYKLRLSNIQKRDEQKNLQLLVYEKTKELLQSKEAIQKSRDELELIMNSTSDGMFDIDNFGICTFVNQAALELLGYAHVKEVIGKGIHQLVHHSYKNGKPHLMEDCFILKSILDGISINKEDIIWKKDGTFIQVDYSSAPKIKDGKIIGAVVSFRDISETRKLIDELKIEHKNLQVSQGIAHLGTWRLDVKTNDVVWTEELYKMYGFDPELPVPNFTEHMKLFTPESWERLSTALELTRTQGIPYELELETVTKDGSNGWMWVRGEAEKDEKGEIVAIWGAAQDITERIRTLILLEKSTEQYKKLFVEAPLGIALIDSLTGQIYEANPMFAKISNRTSEELKNIDWMSITYPDDIQKDLDQMAKLNAGEISGFQMEKRYINPNGSIIWINMTISKVNIDDLTHPLHLSMIEDITERVHKQNQIEYLSNHDYLTDLFSRRYFFEQFKQHDDPKFYPLGVMMIDVNGLKIINDAFGHVVGDSALKDIAKLLKETFAQDDVVSRIGGDEFAVILPNTSVEELQKYKDQLQETIEHVKIENIGLSLAIGYELKTSKTDNEDDFLKLAENHMYRHKSTEGSSTRRRAINAILETLTNKYSTERKHSFEVGRLCKLVGKELNLREDELKELEQAGLFHDIGKISIPDSILNKPGKLTYEEYEIIKTHTEVGYQILRAADEFSDLAIHALHHHERWDGNGYPTGLKGEDIPLFSRIINIVDAYEAMTADRPYKNKMSKEYAISEIKKCSGTQFDPEIAKIFINIVLLK